MAAKYIFGGGQLPGIVSKLFGGGQLPGIVSKLNSTTKNLTSNILTDPHKVENIISMVRTVVPLTSAQTVSKVNTYLPAFEKVSTLLGMFSFLNRTQTFRPIEHLNINSTSDMITALMKNGNMPVNKLISNPIITNSIEKMVGTMAMNMFKNNNMNDLLNNININDVMSAFSQNSSNDSTENKNIDINNMMEALKPIINSMNSKESKPDKIKDEYMYDSAEKMPLRSEVSLPDDDEDTENSNSNDTTYNNSTEKYNKPKNDKNDRIYKNDRYDNYEKSVNYNEHKNNYNDKSIPQKPIRIRQRKKR